MIFKELISCIKNLPNHTKTALQNIWRNGVMSVSSIFAVTVTLLLIGVIGVLAINIQDMTRNVEDSLTIFVKLERYISEEDVKTVGEQIGEIGGIKNYTFSSKDEQLNDMIEQYGEDGKSLFESYREDNPLGDAYIVEVEDPKTMPQITATINDLANVNKATYGGESTSSLVAGLENVRNGGAIFIVALTAIALMLIANTIKITINSRQTEISIMRMVGASNWYIRIPFMIEGILIGILGAIIPIIALYAGYNAIFEQLGGVFFSSMLSLRAPSPFIYEFGAILMLLGSSVGLIGSYVSIRRFLKS